MNLSYIFIPLVTVAVAIIGGFFSSSGMKWYNTIHLPGFTPAGSIIGSVWIALFILATWSALIVWNGTEHVGDFQRIIVLFIVNAVLNVGWSYLFFYKHMIASAIVEAALLGVSVLALIYLISPRSQLASLLLLPYFLWVCFATFLTYSVWKLNR